MRRHALQRLIIRSLVGPGSLACTLLVAPRVLAQQVSPAEDVQITLDRKGPALVRELRHVQLAAGENRVSLYEFAPRILTETVSVRSLGAPATLRLLEQAFWFEVLTRTRLLQTQVGKELRVIREEGGATIPYEGRLLLPPVIQGPDRPERIPLYLEQDDGRIVVLEDGLLDVETLPQGDFHRPRLDWTVSCTRADRHRLELIYETEGLTWSPHLTVRLDDSGTSADLLCVATVTNGCGRDFSDVALQFQDRSRTERGDTASHRQRPSASLYSLGRNVDLHEERTQQFVLAQATGLTGEPRLVLVLENTLDPRQGREDHTPIQKALVLNNQAGFGLGMPLPPGPLEVLRVDANNRPLLVARTAFPGAEPADPVLLPLGAEPGLVARWSAWNRKETSEGQRGTDLRAILFNETAIARPVEIWCPRSLGSRLADASEPAQARGPFVVLTAEVPATGSRTVTWSLVSP